MNNLDNVTIFEKLFLYVKRLFNSYAKILILNNHNDSNYEELIKSISKKYLKLLIKKNPYCINQLLEIYNNCKENILYEIVIFAMKLYFQNGVNYLNNNDFSYRNYKARNNFINCLKLSHNFLEYKKLSLFKNLKEEHDNLTLNCNLNINRIESSLKINCEINGNYDNQKLFENKQYYDKDDLLIILGKYREALKSTLSNLDNFKESNIIQKDNIFTNEIETEAIILANIVKIEYEYLQKGNNKTLQIMAEQSVNLGMSINKNWDYIPWYKEIKSILEEIRSKNIEIEIIDENELKTKILEENKEIFDEIEIYSR